MQHHNECLAKCKTLASRLSLFYASIVCSWKMESSNISKGIHSCSIVSRYNCVPLEELRVFPHCSSTCVSLPCPFFHGIHPTLDFVLDWKGILAHVLFPRFTQWLVLSFPHLSLDVEPRWQKVDAGIWILLHHTMDRSDGFGSHADPYPTHRYLSFQISMMRIAISAPPSRGSGCSSSWG